MPFDDVLGTGTLSAGFDPSVTGPADWAPGGSLPPGPAGDYATPQPAGLNIPLTPPPGPAAGTPSPAPTPPSFIGGGGPRAGGGIDLQQILGRLRPMLGSGQPQSVLSPNSQFMAALGAGLSSAGQNWNKPAGAAFASGAGAALQGGQQWSNQQQDLKLKALHAAIAAWKTGDVAGLNRAVAALRDAAARARASASVPPPTTAAPPSPAAAATPTAAPPLPLSRTAAPSDAIAQARDAIARGAPREAVMARLREHGIDPSGL